MPQVKHSAHTQLTNLDSHSQFTNQKLWVKLRGVFTTHPDIDDGASLAFSR